MQAQRPANRLNVFYSMTLIASVPRIRCPSNVEPMAQIKPLRPVTAELLSNFEWLWFWGPRALEP